MPDNSNELDVQFYSGLLDATNEITTEFFDAISRFVIMRSPHEGLAIILEEYKELEAEVFKQHDTRTKEKMRQEAKQLAAMALRFMVDLT